MASSERFGYEWDTYSTITDIYQAQFRNWVHPLSENDFKNKKILDVGCGMGRNSYWPLTWGAAAVTAFDLDPRTVARAKETLKAFPNATVLQKDVSDMNWQNEFDVVFSIGVIHHLDNPREVLEHMYAAVKPGGKVLVWVYSRQGFEWVVRYVDPIRKNITSRLPLPVVHALSYLLSVPLWAFVKIFKGPSAYLKQLSTFDLWHIHSIVFDQLIPRVANYWSREEVEQLVSGLGLKNVTIEIPPNKNGWTIIGTK